MNLEQKLESVVERRLKGRYREAFKLALQLADMAKSCQRPDIEIKALWEALDSGKVVYPQKKILLENLGIRSLRLAKAFKEKDVEGEARVRWGAMLRALGRHRQAVRVLSKSLDDLPAGDRMGKFCPVRDPQLKAFALWNLGFALRMCLKLDEAKKKFLEARKIFEELKDSSGKAYALCGLAGVTRLLGHPRKSLSLYKGAQKLFRYDRDPYGLAYTYCGIGNGLRKAGRFKEAIASYDKSQKLYKKLGDQVNEGYVLWGRAECFKALADLKKAFQDIRQAKVYFSEGQDQRGLALVSTFLNKKDSKLTRTVLQEAKLS